MFVSVALIGAGIGVGDVVGAAGLGNGRCDPPVEANCVLKDLPLNVNVFFPAFLADAKADPNADVAIIFSLLFLFSRMIYCLTYF